MLHILRALSAGHRRFFHLLMFEIRYFMIDVGKDAMNGETPTDSDNERYGYSLLLYTDLVLYHICALDNRMLQEGFFVLFIIL